MVGNLCVDFQHTLDDYDYYAYTNLFELGKDTGYGSTESGISYSLLNDSPIIPKKAKTFKEFKIQFEKIFEIFIRQHNLTEAAEAPLGNWEETKWVNVSISE